MKEGAALAVEANAASGKKSAARRSLVPVRPIVLSPCFKGQWQSRIDLAQKVMRCI
jgi:hypothetical protein